AGNHVSAAPTAVPRLLWPHAFLRAFTLTHGKATRPVPLDPSTSRRLKAFFSVWMQATRRHKFKVNDKDSLQATGRSLHFLIGPPAGTRTVVRPGVRRAATDRRVLRPVGCSDRCGWRNLGSSRDLANNPAGWQPAAAASQTSRRPVPAPA